MKIIKTFKKAGIPTITLTSYSDGTFFYKQGRKAHVEITREDALEASIVGEELGYTITVKKEREETEDEVVQHLGKMLGLL